MKKCSKCKIVKETASFNTRKSNNNSLQSYCIECAKKDRAKRYLGNRSKALEQSYRANIKSRYGISPEDYNRMFDEQNGKCAICKSAEIKRKNAKRFCIDHCHSTGKVRALLCHDCNVILGKLKDDIQFIDNIKQYLMKSF